MGFEILINNDVCRDGKKAIESVKAAYLYADKVKVYDTTYFFNYLILYMKMGGLRYKYVFDQYPFFNKDVSLEEIALCERKKMKESYGKTVRKKPIGPYIYFMESLQRVRTANYNKYDPDTYIMDLNRLGIEWVKPELKASDLDSFIQMPEALYNNFFRDEGFRLYNGKLPRQTDTALPPTSLTSYLSEYAISSLPGFNEATVDEIIDIKKELDKFIIPYRSAILKMANSIKDIPDTESLQRECAVLYLQEIEPKVKEINTAVRDNNVFKNIMKSVADQKDAWTIGVSAVVAGISTTGSIANAVSASTIAALGGLSIANGINKTLEEKKNIQKNEMYFLYESGKKLEEQQQKKKDFYMYYD